LVLEHKTLTYLMDSFFLSLMHPVMAGPLVLGRRCLLELGIQAFHLSIGILRVVHDGEGILGFVYRVISELFALVWILDYFLFSLG